MTLVVPSDPVSAKTPTVPMLPTKSAVAAISAANRRLRFVMTIPFVEFKL
jgi:hypothetical protein